MYKKKFLYEKKKKENNFEERTEITVQIGTEQKKNRMFDHEPTNNNIFLS